METKVVDNPSARRFEVYVDGQVAGFAAYRRGDGVVTFTHTEIDPTYEGRGLGSVLAREALDATRAAGASVLPECTFIRRYIERHPAYLDLVPAGERAHFGLPAVADRER